MYSTDFSEGKVWQNIVAQSIPLILAQFIQLLYNVVDRIYIGHLPGTDSMALTARKSIFHNFANIRSIKQAIKHDFRNSTFGTRVFFMFFNQVNRQFS